MRHSKPQSVLITELAEELSSQVVVAIESKQRLNGLRVFVNGGRVEADLETIAWVREVQALCVGEILLTSMDHDGVKSGFALEVTQVVSEVVQIPVIASGGAGKVVHFE